MNTKKSFWIFLATDIALLVVAVFLLVFGFTTKKAFPTQSGFPRWSYDFKNEPVYIKDGFSLEFMSIEYNDSSKREKQDIIKIKVTAENEFDYNDEYWIDFCPEQDDVWYRVYSPFTLITNTGKHMEENLMSSGEHVLEYAVPHGLFSSTGRYYLVTTIGNIEISP